MDKRADDRSIRNTISSVNLDIVYHFDVKKVTKLSLFLKEIRDSNVMKLSLTTFLPMKLVI